MLYGLYNKEMHKINIINLKVEIFSFKFLFSLTTKYKKTALVNDFEKLVINKQIVKIKIIITDLNLNFFNKTFKILIKRVI